MVQNLHKVLHETQNRRAAICWGKTSVVPDACIGHYRCLAVTDELHESLISILIVQLREQLILIVRLKN